jgi:hypothetical protein
MPVCIAGMHRSCTSLISAMLQSAGVDVGRDLLGPARGNARGHFEDLGFLQFHQDVLAAHGLDRTGFIVRPRVPVPPSLRPRARHLVAQRQAAGGCWGWKDPRTTLFLDFWAQAVPDLHFLLLFRAPWEVVDSLFRRGDEAFRHAPDLAARVWLNYNRAVLDFQARFPSRCLLLEGRAVADRPGVLRAAINRAFGLGLGPVRPLYDPDLCRQPAGDHSRRLLSHFFPEAVELYERLRQRAAVASAEPRPVAADYLPSWALRHWTDAQAREWDREELRRALERSQAYAQALEGQLVKVRRGATTVWQEAEVAGQELAGARQHIAWMEGSRWRKMRRRWHRLRRRVARLFCHRRSSVPGSEGLLDGITTPGRCQQPLARGVRLPQAGLGGQSGTQNSIAIHGRIDTS